ncbi:MAG TPA: hypothetical protein VHT53_06635 [Candidatus Elarobacter sp.]|nr:hypothetical protein [Candidatus Elarobacter sp.]
MTVQPAAFDASRADHPRTTRFALAALDRDRLADAGAHADLARTTRASAAAHETGAASESPERPRSHAAPLTAADADALRAKVDAAIAPLRSAASARRGGAANEGEREQVVRVSIGRIRIEAPPPASAPARQPFARPRPKLTIDEYARRRGGAP